MSYLGTKNPILVDRRIYAFKGKWHKPRNDIETNIYYFVSTQMTLVEDYENGREIYNRTNSRASKRIRRR